LKDAVIESFNELIKKMFNGSSCSIWSYQVDELISSKLKLDKNSTVPIDSAFIKKSFENSGWKVKIEYNFNDSGSTLYTFSI